MKDIWVKHRKKDPKHPTPATSKKKLHIGNDLETLALLILPVFLGVFSAYLLNHYSEYSSERKQEKEYMTSLTKDLRSDTAYINQCFQSIRTRELSIDSTVKYFMDHPNESKISISTSRQMRGSTWYKVFLEYHLTIDQLRYAGGLRLVQDSGIVHQIGIYNQLLSHFELVRQQYMSNQEQVFSLQEKLWDAFSNIKFSVVF